MAIIALGLLLVVSQEGEKNMKVVLDNLTKRFPNRSKKKEDVVAVDRFTFEIPDGKLQ